MWPLVVLTGWPQKREFPYKETNGYFFGPRKVAVITRCPYERGGVKVGFRCTLFLALWYCHFTLLSCWYNVVAMYKATFSIMRRAN